ncbi:hypothetical protein JCM19037_2012 [Geomicrobium sp. JCM 19037]|uniref:cobalamin B12-binding domain-containing protein n=1 Tax=Geomicrobium sp. JCM 19037 TaxID=1460634 RepID=UPI00045F49C9|nr:B12-binding domain-containing protein [Geomicrobium sp. JCM 19037]GAK03673.1 hypothetical protein JCM19037_2012 [Geomicrobium sp. JCM 19037]
MEAQIEKLADRLLDGDEGEATSIIQHALQAMGKIDVFEQLITPSMYLVGKRWERNEISVADEHLATATVDFILTAMEQVDRKESSLTNRKVLLCGVEDEQHYIGLKMVGSLFRDRGWNVRNLGPNLPLNHLQSSAAIWKPDVIVLSIALLYRLPVLHEYVRSLLTLKHRPSILIGGRVAYEYQLSATELDQVEVIGSLRQLDEWLDNGKVGKAHARTNDQP